MNDPKQTDYVWVAKEPSDFVSDWHRLDKDREGTGTITIEIKSNYDIYIKCKGFPEGSQWEGYDSCKDSVAWVKPEDEGGYLTLNKRFTNGDKPAVANYRIEPAPNSNKKRRIRCKAVGDYRPPEAWEAEEGRG